MAGPTFSLYRDATLFDRAAARLAAAVRGRLPARSELRWALVLATGGLLLLLLAVFQLMSAWLGGPAATAHLFAALLLPWPAGRLLSAAEQAARPTPPSRPARAVPPRPRLAGTAFLTEVRRAGVNVRIARSLYAAGVRSLDDLRRASDAELLAIRGVGPATVRRLRAHLDQG